MAVIDQPTSHREELGLVVERADQRFAITAVLITIGGPVVAYLSGITAVAARKPTPLDVGGSA